jgi:VCBS repeat-containing protein
MTKNLHRAKDLEARLLNVGPPLSRLHRAFLLAGLAMVAVSLWPAFGNRAAAQTSPTLCFGETATITGTGGADNLTGTGGDDVIVGLGGSDKIDGRGGHDLICGGAGHDSITGGDGDDKIDGGSGDDTISGGGGKDRIFGGPGDDSLSGNAGDDQLFGEGGADSMNGGAGSDNCFIESGADNGSGCETDLPPNQAPTDILLAGATIPENEPAGTSVGTLAAVDPDAGDTHTFTVVAASGTDFASFAVSGNSLNSAAAFDFETKSSYTVTIEVSDGLATFQKTFTITVTDADDPPVAAGDSATVSEDSAANGIDVLANDTDVAGGPLNVQSVTQPANGTVVNNGTDVGYTPNADYCNNPTGSGDTFTYTLN